MQKVFVTFVQIFGNSEHSAIITFIYNNLGFILFLGTMFQNPSKLLIIKHAILDGGFAVHFINFFFGESISHCGQEFTETIFMDQSLIFLIKAAKCVLDHIFWVSSL